MQTKNSGEKPNRLLIDVVTNNINNNNKEIQLNVSFSSNNNLEIYLALIKFYI